MLSRVIASAEEDRGCEISFELARIKLREEMSRRPSFNLPGTRDLGVALESAIDRVETIHSKHDSSLEAIRSLDRLADISEAKAQAPGRIVHHDAVMSMNIHCRASERHLRGTLEIEHGFRVPRPYSGSHRRYSRCRWLSGVESSVRFFGHTSQALCMLSEGRI